MLGEGGLFFLSARNSICLRLQCALYLEFCLLPVQCNVIHQYTSTQPHPVKDHLNVNIIQVLFEEKLPTVCLSISSHDVQFRKCFWHQTGLCSQLCWLTVSFKSPLCGHIIREVIMTVSGFSCPGLVCSLFSCFVFCPQVNRWAIAPWGCRVRFCTPRCRSGSSRSFTTSVRPQGNLFTARVSLMPSLWVRSKLNIVTEYKTFRHIVHDCGFKKPESRILFCSCRILSITLILF